MPISLLCRLFLVLVLLAAPSAAFAQNGGKHVRINIIPETTVIRPDSSIMIAIRQDIEEGWHTYWQNPGDSGEAPKIEWDLPPGLEAGPIVYPVPVKIAYGPLVNYGYENRVDLLQEIKAGSEIPPGPLKIYATLHLLVCKDICIPEITQIELSLNGGLEEGTPEFVGSAEDALPERVSWPAKFDSANGHIVITLQPDDPELLQEIVPEGARLFPEQWGVMENAADTSLSMQGNGLVIKQRKGLRPLSEIDTLDAVLAYSKPDGSEQAIRFSARAARVEKASVTIPLQPGEPVASLGTALFFAFLGGLILNLMPCVFPILSIKALGAARLASHSQRLAAAHGLSYTLGILVMFTAVAGLLILLKQAGSLIGWGFQMQNPQVVTFLAWLLFVVGLNFSGVFEFGGKWANAGGRLAEGGGLAGSFFTGVLATMVATPCTAPFMGVALGFALTQSAGVALGVFLALGCGLAAPFLLLSMVPPLLRLLPRPGPWMEKFRHALAYPLYASSGWLVWVLGKQTGERGILLALAGMAVMALALWYSGGKSVAGRRGRGMACLAGVAAVVGFFALITILGSNNIGGSGEVLAEGQEKAFQEEPWSREKLDELLGGSDPVFIEMTADWCITCKVNHKLALDIPQTKELFKREGVRYLVGDWTNYDGRITAFLESHGRSGVPLYVFYGGRSEETGDRPEPVILPQLLTPAIVAGTVSGPVTGE